ncbi:MAG: spore germination protein [Desulfocucumaceae bacterium]
MKKTLKDLLKIISYQENTDREGFILRENSFDRKEAAGMGGGQGASREVGGGGQDSATPGELRQGGDEVESAGQSSRTVQDKSGGNGKGPGESPRQGGPGRMRAPRKIKRAGEKEDSPPLGERGGIRASLDENRDIIENIYGIPQNKDLVLREFTIGSDPPLRSFIVFIDGMVNRTTLNSLLQDLMLFSGSVETREGTSASSVMRSLLPGSQVKLLDSFEKVVEAVNSGDTAFFFHGSTSALAVETKGWEHRGVGRPDIEQTITGPQESFVESLRVNTALVRKIIRSPDLYTEFLKVGKRFPSDVAVMYLKSLANPDLVAEVKKRISSLNVDFLTDTGMLEQLVEDSPYNLNPQTLNTERPDRVAAALADGRVAVLLSGSPFVMVVPVTMYEQLHTGEETYLRWQYGTFLRFIRNISFYLALLLPGSYLAVVLYHQEMLPTELLLAIAGNRERVPFPTIVEMFMMEFAFELVREAGLRIPGIIGSTIGIVGALILGQAAVQANIVSPILVILVAVTGLASFSIPYYSLAFAVRIYRFFYIIMGAMLGFYGITIVLFAQILLTANLNTFGVPYLSPAGPRTYAGPNVVYRLPLFLHRRRPDYLNPGDDVRMAGDPRGWLKGGGGGGGGNSGQG